MIQFEGASAEWLKFVSSNRNVKDFIDDSDIVIGPVAPQKLKDQYAFKSEKALKRLVLSEVIEQ